MNEQVHTGFWSNRMAHVRRSVERLAMPKTWSATASDFCGLVTGSQLMELLGGHCDSLLAGSAGVRKEFPVVRLALAPGDNLYAQGPRGQYAYLVEHGLIERVRQHHDGYDLPNAVSFASAGDLVGMYPSLEPRAESVSAVTRSSLLALPLEELHSLEALDPLLKALISRPLSMALKRDWRTLYRLRDLPPHARTVAGLSHLIHRAASHGVLGGGSARHLNVQLNIECLGQWLGLPLRELRPCLALLEGDGALVSQGGSLITLVPEVMLTIEGALNPWGSN